MIDGLKIEMTTAELSERIAERVRWHQQAAEDCERIARRLPPDDDEEPMRRRVMEHGGREHREQARMLEMLRDHLVPNEVYRLTELDLRFADLVVDCLCVPPELTEPGDALVEA